MITCPEETEKRRKKGAEPLQKRRGLRPAATGGGACYRGDSIHRSGQAGRRAADGWEGSEPGGAGEHFLGRLIANQKEDGGKERRGKMERRGEEKKTGKKRSHGRSQGGEKKVLFL